MKQSCCLSLQVDNETDGISSTCQCCQGGMYQSEFVQHAQRKGMLDLPGLLWGGHGLSLLLEAQGDCLQTPGSLLCCSTRNKSLKPHAQLQVTGWMLPTRCQARV